MQGCLCGSHLLGKAHGWAGLSLWPKETGPGGKPALLKDQSNQKLQFCACSKGAIQLLAAEKPDGWSEQGVSGNPSAWRPTTNLSPRLLSGGACDLICRHKRVSWVQGLAWQTFLFVPKPVLPGPELLLNLDYTVAQLGNLPLCHRLSRVHGKSPPEPSLRAQEGRQVLPLAQQLRDTPCPQH